MRYLFFLALILSGLQASAQNCALSYSSFQKGSLLEYSYFDKDNKLTSSTKQQIVDVRSRLDSTIAVIHSEAMDKKGKKTADMDFELACVKDVVYVDLRSRLNSDMTQAFNNMEVAIEGQPLQYPADPIAGIKLPDGDLTMRFSSGGLNIMTMRFFITNRQVETREKITTAAGSFDAVKITYTFELKGPLGRTVNVQEWVAPGVGLVRSETYNAKGKLEGKTELTSISKK